MRKLSHFPSGTLRQRRINVDATSWRCIDVDTALYKRHVPAWLQVSITWNNYQTSKPIRNDHYHIGEQ